ncbi:MAG: hypothetical protein ACRDP1_13180 [Nocardioidaceae bacterium]
MTVVTDLGELVIAAADTGVASVAPTAMTVAIASAGEVFMVGSVQSGPAARLPTVHCLCWTSVLARPERSLNRRTAGYPGSTLKACLDRQAWSRTGCWVA